MSNRDLEDAAALRDVPAVDDEDPFDVDEDEDGLDLDDADEYDPTEGLLEDYRLELGADYRVELLTTPHPSARVVEGQLTDVTGVILVLDDTERVPWSAVATIRPR